MNRAYVLSFCWLAFSWCANSTAIAQSPELEHFERRIRPVLIERCQECHSAELDEAEGGLRLDSRDAVLRGGDSGTVIVPGDPDASLLIKAISYKDALFQMPPDERLPDRVIEDFRQWVADGAVDPREATDDAEQSQPAGGGPGTPIAEGRKWWAFQPLEQSSPTTSDEQWPVRKIDRFVLQRLETEGLAPSSPADRETLIRRAHADLIGIPPTIEEIDAFINDPKPDAFEQLVDRLLDSQRYGERWGRYWLDVARWAEDHPTTETTNPPHKFAWRYRDWVIESFNDDMPYDHFIRMQFAADQLDGFVPDDLRALGYIGNAPTYHKDPRLSKDVIQSLAMDDWDERVDAVSRGLLGMTVACARCHDHKFDPITSRDYYALAGVFASTWLVKRPIVEMDAEKADEIIRDYERLQRFYGQHLLLPKSTIDPSVHPVADEMKAEIERLKEKLADDSTPLTHAVIDWGVWVDDSMPTVTWIDLRPGEARDLPVFVRGNVATPGEIVPRRFLEVLSPRDQKGFKTGSGRLDLANAILDEGGSLAARVWVNRVWGWHFGSHLVATPSDFGTQGERPTHPELLDDLAARFIDNGWSTKWLHREILLSATWQQSSETNAQAAKVDVTNRLLWRMSPRRLNFEAWRDSLLHSSGELSFVGGPSEEIDDVGNVRRTVFAKVSRSKLHPLLQMYDFPDANQHAPKRLQTTTPLQQLFVMNSQWMQARAEALAKRTENRSTPDERIKSMFQFVFAREPNPDEIETARVFVETAGEPGWQQLAQVLLGSNEKIYLQ